MTNPQGPALGSRIIVTGNSSTGKSTLAAQLAEALGLAMVELDALFWRPNWQDPDPEEFRAAVRQALAEADRGWVVAGNYSARTADITWAAADTVVWLDLPLRVSIPRILKRSWTRSRSQELLWGTNYERFWPHLKLWSTKESLVAFTLRHHRAKAAKWRELMEEELAHLAWFRFRSQKQVDTFLRDVRASRAVATRS